MRGPINFVFMILWIAIGLSVAGTLRECTSTMAGLAVEAPKSQLKLGDLNRKLFERARLSE